MTTFLDELDPTAMLDMDGNPPPPGVFGTMPGVPGRKVNVKVQRLSPEGVRPQTWPNSRDAYLTEGFLVIIVDDNNTIALNGGTIFEWSMEWIDVST